MKNMNNKEQFTYDFYFIDASFQKLYIFCYEKHELTKSSFSCCEQEGK